MKPGKIGILSAALASVCCVGPVLLVLLGLGALGFGAFLGRYHWFFLAGALALLVYAWRVYLKEKSRCDVAHCEMESKKSALTTLILASTAVAAFVGLNVYTYVLSKPAEKKSQPSPIAQETITLPVEGLVCFTCELALESRVKRLEGVRSADASVKGHSIVVTYDPQKLTPGKLVQAINETGYKAPLP